jgi:hypothetical protein
MHASETHRIIPRQGNTAVVTCPQCGMSKTVYVDRLRAHHGPLKVTCTCGPVFSMMSELRKAGRKDVHLDGSYAKLSAGAEFGNLIVTNMSLLGIGFTVLSDHRLKKGDKINVTFTLDDRKHSQIEKSAVVRAINGMNIGCEFNDLSQHRKKLALYLTP